jgi:hypothetical protein
MTALDSNVLIALWDTDLFISTRASLACQRIKQSSPIGICGQVFSELLGFPGRTELDHPVHLKDTTSVSMVVDQPEDNPVIRLE